MRQRQQDEAEFPLEPEVGPEATPGAQASSLHSRTTRTQVFPRKRYLHAAVMPFVAALLVLTPCAPALCDSLESAGARAAEKFTHGDFQQALEKFSHAAGEHNDYRLYLGMGASAYRLKDFDSASKNFAQAAKLATEPLPQATALYNTGNALVQLQKYEQAIKRYEESLKLAPDDREAKENLEYAKKLLALQQEQQNKDNKEQEKPQEQQQEQQQEREKEQQQESAQNQQSESEQSEQSKTQQEEFPAEENPAEEKENSQKSEERPGQQQQEQKAQSGKEPSSASSAAQDRENEPQMSSEAQVKLESLEEQATGRFNYRFKQAMKQLRQEKQSPPEKDW